jgi:hypothetical protein
MWGGVVVLAFRSGSVGLQVSGELGWGGVCFYMYAKNKNTSYTMDKGNMRGEIRVGIARGLRLGVRVAAHFFSDIGHHRLMVVAVRLTIPTLVVWWGNIGDWFGLCRVLISKVFI